MVNRKSRVVAGKHKDSVLERDNYTCQYCGYNIYDMSESRGLTLDHIIPYYIGGASIVKNCITACDKCNKHLSNFIPSESNNIDEAIKEKRIFLQELNKRLNNRNKFIDYNKQNNNLSL